MNVPVVPKVRMNVDEFLVWSERQPDDRYELVDGEIVAMTRDTVRHNRTKLAACLALRDAVRAAGLPCEVFIDGVGVAINEKTLRIPDVVVQCGAEPDPRAMVIESPLIVVEVVSPSSERDDIDTKLMDYFSVASIRHYLIVFSERRAVVHHQRNERGTLDTRIVNGGDIALDPPGLSVSVAALLGL
ncbi:MAG TPA: Uma2 family endonuclease [Xanthobacteraceae bacterium]|nr:Uma2 family endonuclease [Xanthobacteraceae bacterium]